MTTQQMSDDELAEATGDSSRRDVGTPALSDHPVALDPVERGTGRNGSFLRIGELK
jgi:hypothetical protein